METILSFYVHNEEKTMINKNEIVGFVLYDHKGAEGDLQLEILTTSKKTYTLDNEVENYNKLVNVFSSPKDEILSFEINESVEDLWFEPQYKTDFYKNKIFKKISIVKNKIIGTWEDSQFCCNDTPTITIDIPFYSILFAGARGTKNEDFVPLMLVEEMYKDKAIIEF